jgi:SAM-dependent methyltransferase
VELSEATRRSYTGARPDVAALIPDDAQRVLDIGCANGALGGALKQRRPVEVWGIEANRHLAAEASEELDRVIVGDALEATRALEGHFDVVVCADVLEHLPDPHGLMSQLRSRASCAVVSLPNVRFWTTFTQLGLHGRWPQRDRGVHDRTHLRWFTDKDAREMFDLAGFEVEATAWRFRLSDSPAARINRLAPYAAHGPLKPFLTYQMIYRLR